MKTMNVIHVPHSSGELANHLDSLHAERKKFPRPPRRLSLSRKQRRIVLTKTAGRCHLCGGEVTEGSFVADHVLAHAAGGQHAIDNYLPAHGLCNGARWFYSPKEFQWILRMGVWARKQMEDRTSVGMIMCAAFVHHEKHARQPRKPRP